MAVIEKPFIGCQINPGPLSEVSTSGPGGTEVDAARQNEGMAPGTELSITPDSASIATSTLAVASQQLGKIAKSEGGMGSVSGALRNLSSYSSLSAVEPKAHDIAHDEGGGRLLADIEDQKAFEAYMAAEAARVAASGAAPDKSGEIDLKSLTDEDFMTLMRDDKGTDFWEDIG